MRAHSQPPEIERQCPSGESKALLVQFRQIASDTPPEDSSQDEFLRAIFDQARRLGLEMRRQGAWQDVQMADWLSESDLPCLGGQWQTLDQGGHALHRPSCALRPTACDVWREALDGLVMGAGDSLRYARHFSGEFGECVDLLYDEEKVNQRWADIPVALQQPLLRLQERLAVHQAELEWLGYAEGTIYYRLQDRHPQLQGHRHGFLVNSVTDFAATELPEIKLFEASPRAIWDGD